MSIKFSIIIPVYNASQFVEKCIESCVNLTYKNIEIICVDDFSTDNSREILKTCQEKYPEIKCVFHDENKSQFIARRTGFENSSGDYILYLDSDDTLNPDACLLIAKKIRKTGADIIQFAFMETPAENYVLRCFLTTSKERIARYMAREDRCSPQVWDKAYKRSVMENSYNAMDKFYASGPEDLYTSIVFAFFSRTYCCIKKPLLNYSINTGWSIRRIYSLETYTSWLVSYRNVVDHIKFFINKYIPEFNDNCFDMEVYLLRDFLFERIPRDLPAAGKFNLYEILPEYFGQNVIHAFLGDIAHKSRVFDKYLNFNFSFKIKFKRCVKTMLFCLKSLLIKTRL